MPLIVWDGRHLTAGHGGLPSVHHPLAGLEQLVEFIGHNRLPLRLPFVGPRLKTAGATPTTKASKISPDFPQRPWLRASAHLPWAAERRGKPLCMGSFRKIRVGLVSGAARQRLVALEDAPLGFGRRPGLERAVSFYVRTTSASAISRIYWRNEVSRSLTRRSVVRRHVRSIVIARHQHSHRIDPIYRCLDSRRHGSTYVRSLPSEHRVAQILSPHSK